MQRSWLIGRPSLRLHREESNLQVNRRASLCMSYKRSLNKVATHTHTRVYTHIHSLNQICLPHTPTYVAAVLVDGARAGREPHLPKCRHWTDCVGWWMADQGSAGVRRKQLVPCWSLLSSSALHPSLILLLALPPIPSVALPVNHCLPLPITSLGPGRFVPSPPPPPPLSFSEFATHLH